MDADGFVPEPLFEPVIGTVGVGVGVFVGTGVNVAVGTGVSVGTGVGVAVGGGGGGGGGGGTLAGTVTLMLVGWFCCEVVLPVLSTLVLRPSGFRARPTVGGVPGFPVAPVVSRLLVGAVGAEGRTSRVPVVLTAVVLALSDSAPVAEVSTV